MMMWSHDSRVLFDMSQICGSYVHGCRDNHGELCRGVCWMGYVLRCSALVAVSGAFVTSPAQIFVSRA